MNLVHTYRVTERLDFSTNFECMKILVPTLAPFRYHFGISYESSRTFWERRSEVDQMTVQVRQGQPNVDESAPIEVCQGRPNYGKFGQIFVR